ncbi:MAG: RNA pseudouridine synthase [Desulfobacteraceae bacterium]|nr:MAG: RNA pseudouridine synthase [Desulfobacteraceae bacterium]
MSSGAGYFCTGRMKVMEKLIVKERMKTDKPELLPDFLQRLTNLSKIKIKDAMAKGAAWKTDTRRKRKRIRRATETVQYNDYVELYYDPAIISAVPPTPQLLYDLIHYSVWLKPVGLMTQGTDFGDHCSLLRQAEIYFQSRRGIYPVHRLDRETEGLVVIAHTPEAAKRLSILFQKREVVKEYRASVLGNLGEPDKVDIIKVPLDGKESITEYRVQGYDPFLNISTAVIWIQTGRKHQIRRHFESIGHPVIGDPKYGKKNKSDQGLQLRAVSLAFRCPFQRTDRCFHLPED